jgi:hypothetical protein
MRISYLKQLLKTSVRAATVLLLGAGFAGAQTQQVNLSAGPKSATLPDGTSVPMWGYSCGSAVANSTAGCSAANPNAGGNWSPVVITVPSGQDLQINLKNNLAFNGNNIPTSLVIVGQLGGGLGDKTQRTTTPSPVHDGQNTSWPISNAGPVFTPPAQSDRVQSFSTEVGGGATTSLTWKAPRPGTYLLESGTHPSIQGPMGLYGVVVVTSAPSAAGAGTAYPGVSYNAEVPLVFSEIDPVQNASADKAVNTAGFRESATYGVALGGPVTALTVTHGGSGYKTAPTVTFSAAAPAANTATATAVIDTDSSSPTYGQVTEIDIVNAGSYASAPTISITPAAGDTGTGATAVPALGLAANGLSLCSGGAAACYPPVVNYSPRYYLINGVAFDKTNATHSLFAANKGGSTAPLIAGNVLVRLVNAGLRMHVPSIVGSTIGAAGGFSLIAEDGNVLPGTPRVQSEVFMAAGKTYDVMITAPVGASILAPPPALPIFDRQLSLSGNSSFRDAGMLAYISINGGGLPGAGALGSAKAYPDEYDSVLSGKTLTVSDPGKGVIANDVNIYGVKVVGTTPTGLVLNADGTFTYTGGVATSFTYCGNGATSGDACATVTLGAASLEAASGISCPSTLNYNATLATSLKVSTPGVLSGCMDGAKYPLKASAPSQVSDHLTLSLNENGGFTASVPSAGTYQFTFAAQNSQGTPAPTSTTVTLTFPPGSGLTVTVLDGADKTTTIGDYRWIIEEDRTFYVDPSCSKTPLPSGCPASPVNFGTNFHTSYMPVIASGCTGDESCANSQTVLGQPIAKQPFASPGDIALCKDVPADTPCLDPNKRYYISVLPGDAAQPFIQGYAGAPDCTGAAGGVCGHGMGGAPIAKGAHDASQSITVMTEPSPFPPATLSVFVFEDDYPLNGEHDAGGGIDVLSPNEPGLGGFQITLADDAGGTGDATGNPTYDMFNMPLSNSLAGTIDPVTKMDACPLSTQVTSVSQGGDSSQNGIVGMIITCPKYESDGTTLSPLAGQAVVKNLWQGRYGVIANPGADRLARGEEWVQTNTLDGQKAHDSFMRIGEPAYFQEFGPAGYHVTIGFANPKIINDRGTALCNAGADCNHEVKGQVTTARMSRTPDERLYGSGSRDAFSFTQCYVSIGDPDGGDFQFAKCDGDGNFDFKNVPAGNWKITTFDQWNDQVVDGITTPVGMCDPGTTDHCKDVVDMGEVAVHQWQANIYTRTFLDTDFSGVSNDQKPGLPLVATNIRFRDGSFSNFNSTDLSGFAGFNEVFPLFNWYVIETDSTRYKNTGTHVVYDAGGPTDGSQPGGTPCSSLGSVDLTGTASKPCGNSGIAGFMANTYEPNPLPADLSVPGAVYCADADCGSASIANGPVRSSESNHSTGRIDPAWVNSYGWQGFSGQNSFLEFGKKPFAAGENGGIHGHVVYASTRPFDDPKLLLQLSWEPLIPHVKINLYKEGFAADGVTPTLTLVDHTETTSFDDWVQGFRSDGVPNMNCPGQGTDASEMPDPYFWNALKGQPQWLDFYANNGAPSHTMPYESRFKCYDGMHNWNQLQPAPYDGMYSFPSVTSINASTGKPEGTNCTICTSNPSSPDSTNPDYDPYRSGAPMLPDGKYVVEVVVPAGYELVKEEDKNILIGDNFIAPVTQQFGGLGSIFIMPDQAEIAAAYNSYSPQNPTYNLGLTENLPSHEGDTGSIETFWPCVGQARNVPDFISLFPDSQEVSPFAGAMRPLCDRKEVTLTDQTSGLVKFYLFTPTHTASHFTGVITDDFTAEFDPYSPQFGEKFAPAYLPVSFKDWAGNEINRVYADAWGAYNGLNYSTWEVNPPNPTGYGPTMMVGCMNDAGPVKDVNGQMVTDPYFQDGYSQFCYELPFMPGQTGYFDTPVVPTSAFAGGYNPPDCAYPDATPAVSEVDGDNNVGPWLAGLKGTVTTVAVTNGGSGYTSPPTVTFNNAGTNGSGAAASAVISGHVTTVAVTNGGRGYTAAPGITFSGGGNGSGAAATANMTGSVSRVNITLGGVYPRTGTGSTITVTIDAPGAGGTQATATANTTNINTTTKRVSSVTINNPGRNYSGTVHVTFSAGTTTATGTVTLAQSVASVTVTNGGSGYSSAPTVTFAAAPFGGTRAAGTATQSAIVVAVNITNAGSNYTSAPTIGFTGGGGSNAAATASVELNGTITIKKLGDQLVDNYEYTGPLATAPYNQMKVTRHYSFGGAPTDFSKLPAAPAGFTYNCNSTDSITLCPYVTIANQALTAVSWSDDTIKGTVPGSVPACTMQQQAQYGGSKALCGQLSITAANGKQSVDTVTVTVGGKAPVYVSGTTPLTASGFGSIQKAIDGAQPGDLIIVPPGTYSEMLLMWKPVRLQGVGAASSIIDANAHPAGKLDPWRQRVVCLFGLALNGIPITNANPYDPSSSVSCDSSMQFSVDRLPLEATVGWDATLNGNLAEQLIEPTLMGAYEGAGITVLAKGVKFPAGSNPFASDVFPDGTQLLTTSDCGNSSGRNPYPGNFLCNPSSIDGLTVKNSSQGGGGIFVHGWGHDLQIANNRVLNNQGTMSGGITIGQGEHPDAYLVGGIANTVPGSCILNTGSAPTNMALPYCFDMDVNVHNNAVSQNSSLGDELFSSTPAGAGGVTFCNGSDYYKFNFNWVCGNMSTGDGAGVAHAGFTYDGDIEHNTILYNQSTNPTIVTNGGGLLIMGAPDADPPCGILTDQDCVSPPGSILPSDGTGPGLVINANLILGNSADSGSGGGLRLQHVNGTDVLNFRNGSSTFNGARWPTVPGHSAQPAFQLLTPWNAVSVTNNIIANNVAGWDGGGVSLLDALATNLINNTIVSNNSTASSGVLFTSLFAPLASTQGDNCSVNNGAQSCPQPAGLVSVTNSEVLKANIGLIGAPVTCPSGHGTRNNPTSDCTKFSVPVLYNDLFWQNRSLLIGVGGLGNGVVNQQNTVTVYDPAFGHAQAAAKTQAHTGSCDDPNAAYSYWDIGVRGDTAPGNHASGFILAPVYSALTNPSGTYGEGGAGSNNLLAPGSTVTSTYCNGSRVPVEATVPGSPYPGWTTLPGTNESNALPAPPFTLLAAATVDEGNNWINLRWGPLSLNVTDPTGTTPEFAFDAKLIAGSPAINAVPVLSTQGAAAPGTDFYGNPRKLNAVDIGAIEVPAPPAPTLTSISPTSGARGTSVPVTLTGTNLTGATAINVSGSGFTVTGLTVVNNTTVTATFVIASSAGTGGTRTVSITTPGGTSNTVNFNVVNPPTATLTSVSPNTGARSTAVPVTLIGTNFTTGSTVAVSGGGVSVSGVTVVNSTTITATFTISGSSALGSGHSVTVTNANGTASNGVSFTVTAGTGPTLTSISPTSGTRGTSVPVTLTGTNLTGATGITVSGSGFTVSNLVVVNSTTITATFTIAPSAGTLGSRSVQVTTPGGTSNSVNFDVNYPGDPTLTSVSPNSGARGTSVSVILTGTNFTTTTLGTPVTVSGSGVTVSNVTVVSSTQITATFTISGGATVGSHSVRVNNASLLGLLNPSNAVTFTVN